MLFEGGNTTSRLLLQEAHMQQHLEIRTIEQKSFSISCVNFGQSRIARGMYRNCVVCIVTSAMKQSWRTCQVSDSGGLRGISGEASGYVGECFLVNGLCVSRGCVCSNLLVSICIKVFMHHLEVCVCSFDWNLRGQFTQIT